MDNDLSAINPWAGIPALWAEMAEGESDDAE